MHGSFRAISVYLGWNALTFYCEDVIIKIKQKAKTARSLTEISIFHVKELSDLCNTMLIPNSDVITMTA